MVIQVKKGFVLRKIGPQYMAVPFGEMTGRVKGMITLTESGYLLWQALEKGTNSLEGLADILLENYEVERDVALQDAAEFVAFLGQLGIAEVTGA